jgi:hypothetical protein
LQDEIRNELNVSKQKIVVEEREKNVLKEEILASKHSSEVLSSITSERRVLSHVLYFVRILLHCKKSWSKELNLLSQS